MFAGAAWVLFRKPEGRVEILNDINRDLVTLYRCVKHHLPELVAQFRWMLVARNEFDAFLKTPADTLTDIQRSARFYYLNKTSFGARLRSPSFGIAASQAPRLNLLRLEEDLSEAHLRLSRVYIECRPWSDVIARFDREGMLFYLDPPYWGCEDDYGVGLFSRADFEAMASQLSGIKGRFILSLNDTPGVREVFGAFKIEEVVTRYSVSAHSKAPANEVLVTNF